MRTPFRFPALPERQPAPTLIALHASGHSARQWQPLRGAFGGCAEVAAPDFHGHGAGPEPPHAPERALAADTAIALREIDAAPGAVHLVGHSYGGAVALRAAMRRRGKVASLVLYEPVAFDLLLAYNPRHPPAVEIVEVGQSIARRVMRGDLLGAAERFVGYWSGTDAWAALLHARRAAIASRMAAVHGHFRALFAARTRPADYARLDVPVLLLSGARSKRPTARIVELLAGALPRVTAVRLAECGHMGPVTHPDPFLAHAAAFVSQHAGTRLVQPLPRAA